RVILEGLSPPPTVGAQDASSPASLGFEIAVGPVPTISSYEPNRVAVEASTLRIGYLVLADVSFPGWTVRVDGVEQPLLRADRIFRAVQLAPGEHEVLFEYKPLSFRLGGLLSLLAIGLAGLALGTWGYACLGFGAMAP